MAQRKRSHTRQACDSIKVRNGYRENRSLGGNGIPDALILITSREMELRKGGIYEQSKENQRAAEAASR